MNDIEKTYCRIENIVLEHIIYQNVKDYSKNKEKMMTYLKIGELLSSIDTKYGNNIIKEYSNRLINKFGKRYSVSLLYKIKQFYSIIQKVPTMSGKLTWSHWYEMLSMNDVEQIKYYVQQCEIRNLDVRSLRRIIKSKEYDRLDANTKSKLLKDVHLKITDSIKNPILIQGNNRTNVISERYLQKLILENLSSFLKELGNGFCFVDSEFKIKIDDRYNYIDILLFNVEFNCYVVIELKTVELKKEHIGQIKIYMNYIDKNIKKRYHKNTIGIIICKKENNFIIEYCSDKRIISREYVII